MSEDYLGVGDFFMYDTALSSWMMAYRINARSLLVKDVKPPPSEALVFLFVAHKRTPLWMNNITWTVRGVKVQPIDFAKLPIHDQFAQTAKANGLIGVQGSGLAQQIFLPIGSSVLQVSALHAANESDTFGRGDGSTVMHGGASYQNERDARCYGNTAIHVGNSLLNWRYCRPGVQNESAAFSDQDAQDVMKLLLSETQKAQHSNSARLCTVFNSREFVETWPRCDSLLVAPILQPRERCSHYGLVGKPFGSQDKRTVAKYCTETGHCY